RPRGDATSRPIKAYPTAGERAAIQARADQALKSASDYLVTMGVNGAVLDVRAILVLDADLRNVQEALDMLQRHHPGELAERALASFLHLGTRLTRAQLSPEVTDYLVADDAHGSIAGSESRSIALDLGSILDSSSAHFGGSQPHPEAQTAHPTAPIQRA
ncbi:MAG: hypothetical protein AB1941_01420, partial [Gemmatimonadota bacterium]